MNGASASKSVGGWNESFDMRAMAIGEVRDDVNLRINTYAPDGNIWRLMFEPHFVGWGTTGDGSTYITVTRSDTDAWEVELDASDIAVLVVQTPEKSGRNRGTPYLFLQINKELHHGQKHVLRAVEWICPSYALLRYLSSGIHWYNPGA